MRVVATEEVQFSFWHPIRRGIAKRERMTREKRAMLELVR
jgi:hypothetical protein